MKYLNKTVDLAVVLALFYGLYFCRHRYDLHLGHTYQHIWGLELLFFIGNIALAAVAALLLFRGAVQVRLSVCRSVQLFVGLVLLILAGAYFWTPWVGPWLYRYLAGFSVYGQVFLGVWLALLVQSKIDAKAR